MISVATLDEGFSNSSKVGMSPNTPQLANKKNSTIAIRKPANAFQNSFRDDERISFFLVKGLEENGYQVTLATSAEEARSLFDNNHWNILIVDIMLPGIDGIQFIKMLRYKNILTPVIVISALNDTMDKIQLWIKCWMINLVKPFHFDELLRGLKALYETSEIPDGHKRVKNELICGDLRIDLESVSFSQKKISKEEVERTFLENNFELISQKFSLEQSQAELIQARLWANNPNLTIGEVNLWRNNPHEEMPYLFGRYGKTQQVSLELEQVIETADEALANRSDFKLIKQQKEIAHKELDIEKAARIPDVTVGLGYDRGGNIMQDFCRSLPYSLMMMLKIFMHSNMLLTDLMVLIYPKEPDAQDRTALLVTEKSSDTLLKVICDKRDYCIQDWVYRNAQTRCSSGSCLMWLVFGWRRKILEIKINPTELNNYNLSPLDVYEAVSKSNINVGGDVIQQGNQAYVTGPASFTEEGNTRYIGVGFSIEGRDLGSTIAEAKAKVAKEVKLPKENNMEWAGEFESKERASKQLMTVVPISLVLILMLLYANFGNLKDTIISAITLPFAFIGGFLSLWITGTVFGISAGIGFIILFGSSKTLTVFTYRVMKNHLKH
ncbi:hypothetical protein FQR65_LT19271 [Abscondita terminalis]|nr:hypothetical protein FQR65_LT19271 [Abscondita terminalis]